MIQSGLSLNSVGGGVSAPINESGFTRKPLSYPARVFYTKPQNLFQVLLLPRSNPLWVLRMHSKEMSRASIDSSRYSRVARSTERGRVGPLLSTYSGRVFEMDGLFRVMGSSRGYGFESQNKNGWPQSCSSQGGKPFTSSIHPKGEGKRDLSTEAFRVMSVNHDLFGHGPEVVDTVRVEARNERTADAAIGPRHGRSISHSLTPPPTMSSGGLGRAKRTGRDVCKI